MISRFRIHPLLAGFYLGLLVPLLAPATGNCVDWRVSPVVIQFDRETKSSTITVMNDGTESTTFQLTATEWTQDADGKDSYTPTNDVVFFPKMLVIPPREQKIVRTGIKVPATAREKTYRLFIQELPRPRKSEQDGAAQVAILVKFGVAVYAKPLKEERKGELKGLSLEKGSVVGTIGNPGNVHLRVVDVAVRGVSAKGEETFRTRVDAWNLLSGSARSFSIPVPAEKCGSSTRLEIVAETETGLNLSGKLDVEKARCQQ